MKSEKELNSPKEEVETVNNKFAELNEKELVDVSGGGISIAYCPGNCGGSNVVGCDERNCPHGYK